MYNALVIFVFMIFMALATPLKAKTVEIPPAIEFLKSLVPKERKSPVITVDRKVAKKEDTVTDILYISCTVTNQEDRTRRKERTFEVSTKKTNLKWIESQKDYVLNTSYTHYVFFDESTRYILNRLTSELDFIEKDVLYHGVCTPATKPKQLI